MRPLADRILVRPDKAEEKTEGGIIIPTKAQEVPSRGVVIAVGEGRVDSAGDLFPLRVKVGDRVWYAHFAGTVIALSEFSEDDKPETLRVLRESELLLYSEGTA